MNTCDWDHFYAKGEKMERKQNESITPVDLYRLALLTLNTVNNELATSFKTSFPDIEQLSKKYLEASLLSITDSVPAV